MIKRALLSVYEKAGIVDLAGYLRGRGVEITSSGGTHKTLAAAGILTTKVSEITGAPEILGGRVKTLHPAIHAGILAKSEQIEELKSNKIKPYDLVVVNLYPFEKIIEKGPDLDMALENIDIGGPAMLRAAAKNFPRVAVICDPDDYGALINEMDGHGGETSLDFRRNMALKVFARTSAYDKAINCHLTEYGLVVNGIDIFPPKLTFSFARQGRLRYGENPHQQAALYIDNSYPYTSLPGAQILAGKELSFNNFWDLEAALAMAFDFAEPFAAVIKHTNPCGAAIGTNLAEAYHRALESDPLSAFGSVIGLNRPVDMDAAQLLHETHFIECILAPAYEPGALELLKKKKQRRLVAVGELQPPSHSYPEVRRIFGGALVQTRDTVSVSEDDLKTVTKKAPDHRQLSDLLFAFKMVKHVKSNAVIICKNGATVGIGPGQTSRVDASIMAVRKAGDRSRDAVAASDAFFPMPDGLEVLAEAGVRAIIQPGGSKADPDVIAAADRFDIAMVFTGLRHFKH